MTKNTNKSPYSGKRQRKETVAAAMRKLKETRVPVAPKCPKCRVGTLVRKQWNRLMCTEDKCFHSQLQ